MGSPATTRSKPPVIRRPAVPATGTIYDWMDTAFKSAGIGVGGGATIPERVFFLPEIDSDQLIKEGPPPRDWEGYHAGKHGLFDRFQNTEGVMVNMGEAFFKEKFRWIRPEFLKDPNTLRYITEAEAMTVVNGVFKDSTGGFSMKGIFDSRKFTEDVKTLAERFIRDPKSTVWQGRYIRRDGTLDALQTNIDFEFNGKTYRIAIDVETGQALNFFEVFKPAEGLKATMQYAEVSIRWKGQSTNVEQFTREGSDITIGIASNWKGVIVEHMRSALQGGIVGAFLGAIDGMIKDGITGAFKGLAIGAASGTIGGVVASGLLHLLKRLWPSGARIAGRGLAILSNPWFIAASILLDSREAGRGSTYYNEAGGTDDDGNVWRRVSAPYESLGIKVITKDGPTMYFGQNCDVEMVRRMFDWDAQSPGLTSNPITRMAVKVLPIDFHVILNSDGSSMWWWKPHPTGYGPSRGEDQVVMIFQDIGAMTQAMIDFHKSGKYPLALSPN